MSQRSQNDSHHFVPPTPPAAPLTRRLGNQPFNQSSSSLVSTSSPGEFDMQSNSEQSGEMAPLPSHRESRSESLDRPFSPEEVEHLRNLNRRELAVYMNKYKRGTAG